MKIMIMIPRGIGFRTSRDLVGWRFESEKQRNPAKRTGKKMFFFSFVVASDFSILFSTPTSGLLPLGLVTICSTFDCLPEPYGVLLFLNYQACHAIC